VYHGAWHALLWDSASTRAIVMQDLLAWLQRRVVAHTARTGPIACNEVIERTEAFLAAPGGGAMGAGEDVGLLAPLSPTVARV
jgi:hypothetical protein